MHFVPQNLKIWKILILTLKSPEKMQMKKCGNPVTKTECEAQSRDLSSSVKSPEKEQRQSHC